LYIILYKSNFQIINQFNQMDQFQAELAETIRVASIGEVRQPGQDPFDMRFGEDDGGRTGPEEGAQGPPPKLPPGLEGYSHA